MKNDLMAVIVLNWNRKKYSQPTIENIIKRTTVPHVLVLVDNNSTEESGVKQYLSSITSENTKAQDVMYVFNKKNLGVAGGRNSGINAVIEKYDKRIGYITTIDDDVLVPERWDVHMKNACDRIPKLGITGVNVEPAKYNVAEINGVRVRPKTVGNLGGACLSMPRRVFSRVGFYRIFGQYGLEDSDMYIRLKVLGLISAYIEPKGVHMDNDQDKVYRKVKNRAHKKGSSQLRAFSQAKLYYEKTGNVYVGHTNYDPDDTQWQCFERFDGTINARLDVREVLDSFGCTKGIKIGNKLVFDGPNTFAESPDIEIASKNAKIKLYSIDTGAEARPISLEEVMMLVKKMKDANIACTVNVPNFEVYL